MSQPPPDAGPSGDGQRASTLKRRTPSPDSESERAANSPGGSPSKKARGNPLDEKTAARRITKFFRYVLNFTSTKRIAALFMKNGPMSFTKMKEVEIKFDELAEGLRKHEVIEAAGDLLLRVIQLCNWGRKDQPMITGTLNAKIYLAAYMIAFMPKNVFDEIGDLENKVIAASLPLVEAFHEVAGLLKGGSYWSKIPIAKELPTLLCTYLRTFKEWKTNDEKRLAGRLRRALKGIEEVIAKGGRSAGDLKELEEQKQKLEAKLRQIAGVGKARDSGAAKAKAATVLKTHDVQDIASGGGGGGAKGGMTNEQLAHELMIDADFKLDDKAGMSDEKLVHTKIRETFERAFWDSLVDDLSCDPPSFAPVLNVLSEIRTGIVSLSQDKPEAHQIREIIDVEHIKSQLKEGSLDFRGCERLIGGIIGVVVSVHVRMGAKEREEETLAKWKECQTEMQEANGKERSDRARAICRALEMVLDRVHKIRVDTANAKLRAIAPVIRQHGVEYEKSHFAKKKANGTITMARTEKWINHTVKVLEEEKDPVVDLRKTQKGDRPGTYKGVVDVALVDLVAEYPNWGGEKRGKEREDEMPETMMLDLLRVKALNVHFHTDVVSTIIMTQVDQEVRNRAKPDANVRAKLLRDVADILKKNPPKPSKPQAVIEQVMDEISKHFPKAGDAQITRALIDKHVQKAHPVYVRMVKHFKHVWYHRLAGSHYSLERIGVAKCMEQETIMHAEFLRTIAIVNRHVHTSEYNYILNKTFGVDASVTSDTNMQDAPASTEGDTNMQDAPGAAPSPSRQ